MTEWLPFHFSLSCFGEENGNPLQCSCLENPRDGGAWWAAIYGVTQSRIRLKWLSSSRNHWCGKKSIGFESRSPSVSFLVGFAKTRWAESLLVLCEFQFLQWSCKGEGFLPGRVVKSLPAMQEPQKTQVQSPVGKIPWRRAWQHPLVFLLENSPGERRMADYSPMGHKESDTAEWLSRHAHNVKVIESLRELNKRPHIQNV